MGMNRNNRPPRVKFTAALAHADTAVDLFANKHIDEDIKQKLSVGKWRIDVESLKLKRIYIAASIDKDHVEFYAVDITNPEVFEFKPVPRDVNTYKVFNDKCGFIANESTVNCFTGKKSEIMKLFTVDSCHGVLFDSKFTIEINRNDHMMISAGHLTIKPYNGPGGVAFSEPEKKRIDEIKDARLWAFDIELSATKIG